MGGVDRREWVECSEMGRSGLERSGEWGGVGVPVNPLSHEVFAGSL